MDHSIARDLSQLEPDVPFRASSGYLHHTWAKTYFSSPELYIQPESVEEIQKIVILARRCHRHLVIMGNGHSPSNITCNSAWMINLDNFNRLLKVDGHLATVQAEIRLKDLGDELEQHHLTVSNLGSIDSQSIAGALATGTHGGSMRRGLLSGYVESFNIVLSDGGLARCSESSNKPLFRAALVSLGAVGVIAEVTLRAEDAFNVEWRQSKQTLTTVLCTWSSSLWNSHDFIRVLWLPYDSSAIIWHAERTLHPVRTQKCQKSHGDFVRYHAYQLVLAVANKFPCILPWIEWAVTGMQYGFGIPSKVIAGVCPARKGLLMDPLYPQLVNELALPFEHGPKVIRRLSAWLRGDYEIAQIPISSKGVWINCAIEISAVFRRSIEKAWPSRAANKPRASSRAVLRMRLRHWVPSLVVQQQRLAFNTSRMSSRTICLQWGRPVASDR